VHPADSRCVVYDSVDAAHRFWIKGQHFSIAKLMGPGYDSGDHWAHAALAINRWAATRIECCVGLLLLLLLLAAAVLCIACECC
jgi:hypothetical protein